MYIGSGNLLEHLPNPGVDFFHASLPFSPHPRRFMPDKQREVFEKICLSN